MDYQQAKSWVFAELGRIPELGVSMGDAVHDLRDKLDRQVAAASPREGAVALVKLHELDFHVRPALFGEFENAPAPLPAVDSVPLSRQQAEPAANQEDALMQICPLFSHSADTLFLIRALQTADTDVAAEHRKYREVMMPKLRELLQTQGLLAR